MEAQSPTSAVTTIARAIWECNKTARQIADMIGVGERRLRQLLQDEKKEVPIHLANQVSSFAERFTLPVVSDQPTVIVMSRKLTRMATSHADVSWLIARLEADLKDAEDNQDFNMQALLQWQLVFANIRASSLLCSTENEGQDTPRVVTHIENAAKHAQGMTTLLPRTTFKDPALMRVVERRNWATTRFLKGSVNGRFPSTIELRQYIDAYNEAEAEIGKTHLDLDENKGDRDAALANMRLPMRRALCLDQVEMAAYLGDRDLVLKCIANLRQVGDCKSARAFQLALESMPTKAKNALWGYGEWKALMEDIQEKVDKRADTYLKE